MSDTPRTDTAWETLPSVYEFIAETRRMERELNEANDRIKRLEREVELFREYSDYGDVGVVDSILRGEEMERKEAKP
jgi:predicted nuclease with TOPRIM domain